MFNFDQRLFDNGACLCEDFLTKIRWVGKYSKEDQIPVTLIQTSDSMTAVILLGYQCQL